jgi:hypothetical protein
MDHPRKSGYFDAIRKFKAVCNAEAEMRPHQALQTRYYFPQGKTAACPGVA